MKTLLVIIFLFWGLGLNVLFAQSCFRVVSYNVENFFDCKDNPQKQDDDFTPQGDNHWTLGRYWKKQQGLAKVVAAFSSERLPDMVGLCEVENDSVLFDLTRRSPLRVLGYDYITTDSPDLRGINVALLYQPGSFKLLNWHAVRIPSSEYGFRSTRDILYASGQLQNGDTLHVMMCHFPSRAGQTLQANRHRLLAAQTLHHTIDSICALESQARIIVMGDFNAGISDKIFSRALKIEEDFNEKEKDKKGHHVAQNTLCAVPLSFEKKRGVRGSYRYQGIWEHIDHILVSRSLILSEAPHWSVLSGSYCVAAFPFLCESERTHGGIKPWRTYQGPFYKGGYSDHFPVVLDLAR